MVSHTLHPPIVQFAPGILFTNLFLIYIVSKLLKYILHKKFLFTLLIALRLAGDQNKTESKLL